MRDAAPGTRPRVATWLPLAAILAVAAAARIAAFTGQAFSWGSDESRFIAVAQNLANGHFPSGDAEWFGARVGLLWPVAGLFRILEASDATAAIWPLVGSLLAVVAAYLLGRELAGRRVGLVASALVAVVPLEALVGTHLRPDAIMPAVAALAAWCALRARRDGAGWALAAGVLLGLAWSVRESGFVMAPVLLLAGWGAGRRALVGGVVGAALVPAAATILFAVGAGEPLRPLTGAGTEGELRNPVEAFSLDGTYLATIGRQAFDPGAPLFLLAPAVLLAIAALVYRRDRRAVLPAAWLAWAGLYLELGTLVNLAKPVRYLTLCTIPAALLIALAVDGRLAIAAPVALTAVAIAALWTLPARDLRPDDVTLVARVADRLRALPERPVLAESYTWWAKLTTYTATRRLPIPRVKDPEFVSAEEARRGRQLVPLPVPSRYRGGYVVTGPIHPRSGWPSNWGEVRARIASEVPWARLALVATVGEARIWSWPR